MKKIAVCMILSAAVLINSYNMEIKNIDNISYKSNISYAEGTELTPPPAPAEVTAPEGEISETGEPDEKGTYNFTLSCMKEHVDELSMAGTYVQPKAALIKTDKGNLASVKFMRSDWMKKIKVEIDGEYVDNEIEPLEGTEFNVKFKLPKGKPVIKIKLFVVPMDADVAFRLVPNYDFVKISDEAESDSPVLTSDNSSAREEAEKEEKEKADKIAEIQKNNEERRKKAEEQNNEDSKKTDSNEKAEGSKINGGTIAIVGAVLALAILILLRRKK